jgi:hypothetical protein
VPSGSGLEPGYYHVNIVLKNDYQRAGISEIVHIYSNMETKAEYAYTEADFVDFVTLSGTIKVDGTPISGVWLEARERWGDDKVVLRNAEVSDGNWTMQVPAVSESTEIYFATGYQGNWIGNIPGITLNPGDTAISDIAIKLITLSGTVTATVNGATPHRVSINAYRKDGGDGIGSTSLEPYSSGDSWSIFIPAFSVATNIAFSVDLFDSSDKWLAGDSNIAPTQVHNSAVPNINLNYSSITLSGTISTVTANNATPDRFKIEARNQNDEYLGDTWQEESGAWAINISSTKPELASTTSIRFKVGIDIGPDNFYLSKDIEGTHTYNEQSISNIVLGSVNFEYITLSGTIGTVTIDGVSPAEIGIQATDQEGRYLASTWTSNGAWFIPILKTNPELAAATSIKFKAEAKIDGSNTSQYIPGMERTYSGQSISDIALGNASFIALSGTIGALTANGVTHNEFDIQVVDQKGDYWASTWHNNNESSEWAILISTTDPRLASTESIKFKVGRDIDGSFMTYDIPDKTQTNTGQGISGIALGNVSFITLRGTIGTVTVDGAPISQDKWFPIQAFNQNDASLGETWWNSNSAWYIPISTTNPDLVSTTSIKFKVGIYIDDDTYLEEDISEATRTYNGQGISNITLGDVAFTSSP